MSTGDLEQLARWRTLGARYSEEVVQLGQAVLESGRLGDQGGWVDTRLTPIWQPVRTGAQQQLVGPTEWSIREQIAVAALDIGKIQLATVRLAVIS